MTSKFKKERKEKMSTTQKVYEGIGTVRKHLCGGRYPHREKFIDMEYVYRELSKGRTRQSVADELDVHVNTLYNHHKKYQAQLQVLLKEREKISKQSQLSDEIPPLPEEFQ